MKQFAGDIIVLHMCSKNHNHMMYGFWNTEWDRQNFLIFWAIFCPFTTPTALMIHKNQSFEKKNEKNVWRYYPFYIYMYAINEHHMIYGSWNVRCDWQKFLSFCVFFCPFIPLATRKIRILKLQKAPGDIIISHICTINDNHMMYGSSDMERDRQNFLLFWTIFCPFTPKPPQQQPTKWKSKKKLKKKKNAWRYHHFTIVQQKSWSYAILFLRYSAWQMSLLFFPFGYFLFFYSTNSPKNQN